MYTLTLSDVLDWRYSAVEQAACLGTISPRDWQRYRMVWRYASPRFSDLVDAPCVRYVNALLDGDAHPGIVETLAYYYNGWTRPDVYLTAEEHTINDDAARVLRRYLMRDTRVSEHEYSGALVVGGRRPRLVD